MDFLTDWLTNWLKELLISGIMGNLEGLFDTVNAKVGEIAVQVGTTPAAWNAGVFSLIRQLSETVILPIAGLVLTFVAGAGNHAGGHGLGAAPWTVAPVLCNRADHADHGDHHFRSGVRKND